ncbi:MAG: hypothetical protein U9R52_00400 [Candidatus Omnitrophota bacterium]|nr:hypothetical protein [Candidatus Omnitrophota bacterium]
MDYVDIWGMNYYPGTDFQPFFDFYAPLTRKPLWISEYGIDVINGGTNVDETAQASCLGQGWDSIEASLSAYNSDDICLGVSIMAYSNEWWKHEAGDPGAHDYGGSSGWEGRQPDGFSNEEWYGIMEVSLDGPDADDIDDVTPRIVYTTLQTEWGG